MALFQTYNFPDHIRGNTFPGLQFTLKVNGAIKSLAGARIDMAIGSKRYSTLTGELYINDDVNGKFQFKPQVILLPLKKNSYEMTFYFSDGTVKKYLKGTWKIIS